MELRQKCLNLQIPNWRQVFVDLMPHGQPEVSFPDVTLLFFFWLLLAPSRNMKKTLGDFQGTTTDHCKDKKLQTGYRQTVCPSLAVF